MNRSQLVILEQNSKPKWRCRGQRENHTRNPQSQGNWLKYWKITRLIRWLDFQTYISSLEGRLSEEENTSLLQFNKLIMQLNLPILKGYPSQELEQTRHIKCSDQQNLDKRKYEMPQKTERHVMSSKDKTKFSQK